ncbi:hypothetical protein HNQ60_004112 [Povalibacter uvarum]|uniref:DUF4239 domain-containing protein n=1 Tax=Povalibacter uvarum TaxID=732238 RepID=A0A841HT94_9GAMM|nr:hypothetical protein [Povalibacter uvarum]MBB6095222.1 hypothetical protein [Povalibacter uvarum]
MEEIRDLIPIPMLFVLTLVLAFAFIGAGRWLGRRAVARGAEAEGPIGASVGATLGLLAFVLAFTFSMAASRFDARKALVVKDANAIGTTYLRTWLLPEPVGAELRVHLRQYVAIRLDGALHKNNYAAFLTGSDELQRAMWQRASPLAAEQPTSTSLPLFIGALNEMIDVHGERIAIQRNRIPMTIWAFMFASTAIGMLAMGYQAGVSGARIGAPVTCLAVAFAGVIMLISDLDRSQEGFLRISQQSMLELQQGMEADAAADGAAR